MLGLWMQLYLILKHHGYRNGFLKIDIIPYATENGTIFMVKVLC